MVQHDEHTQDDSRPEAGCADASAGSSETPARTDQIKGVNVLLSASAAPVSAAQVRACTHAALDSEFQILE